MTQPQQPEITSLANSRIKAAVKLRQRSHRDESGLMLAEGYREIKRALDSGYAPSQLFHCPELYLKGTNEPALVDDSLDSRRNCRRKVCCPLPAVHLVDALL